MTDTAQATETLVRDFLDAWTTRDLDTICSAFADDAVYHNVPVDPVAGITDIRAIFQAFLDAFAEAKLDIVSLAAAPGLALVERVDYFTLNDGGKVELPVTGVFETANGKITRFSDYFDLADFERQSGFKL
ncbi:limonene-1,2-epoxide hydrolase [Mycolicibacterium novocastrense]|uniref:Limonene-1,2-epoxide hydrolase n=1 Tax=Mycolicibacterium novocastrense TaxID=59813 RepID=A0AAW5SI29_MYCNV|nr:nuclear transport factor 2 family protein [Mycolicibacterium novocastrense]KUH68032.1 limonene-1,2-epoxide hydrolase [Mycolicibacterium novocastrense]KUH68504.1 limonene-1,2-epoxide hydrolase [Mycolicibacterium novocastrense]KUH73585.1 limonene-1,2-epoxide hydrolase [Mycolicibacterium novocastrense]MCV7023225.1 nuclear transport factor 2 family protein [Mycolicibacterium novocastrense]GAT12564.1 limonene-1,2-epoxide hydrolase [Mycolicibacterium novocastrense]